MLASIQNGKLVFETGLDHTAGYAITKWLEENGDLYVKDCIVVDTRPYAGGIGSPLKIVE